MNTTAVVIIATDKIHPLMLKLWVKFKQKHDALFQSGF